ncbi:MAG: 30S ribosomal protein S3 [Thermoguttaceae bacterium]|jgi:small subunit ribosomal protein S3
MGQKVNPVAFRVGVMEDWKSRWYAPKKEFAALLLEDKKIRDYIKKHKTSRDARAELSFPGIARIDIERTREEVRVVISTARPGLIIGRKGERIEELQAELQNLTGRKINLQISEVKNPELVAQLVAENIGEQLVRRMGFRRVIKNAMAKTMEKGAKGIKIQLSGRLGGAEMARREKQSVGSIPLSTLRAKIDYGFYEAMIAQGHIGIQVWINQGEYSEDENNGQNAEKSSASKNSKRSYKR